MTKHHQSFESRIISLRYLLLASLALLITMPASTQQRQTRGYENQRLEYPEMFTLQFPRTSTIAKVISSKHPSSETHDLRDGGSQFCEPSADWAFRLKWDNGSCIDEDGQERRFIEQVNIQKDVLYFRCDNSGVSVRSLYTDRDKNGIGHPKYGDLVSTRVVLNGREVGEYLGFLPNIYIAGDIRHIPTNDGTPLLEKLKAGSEGKVKLVTTQEHGTQTRETTYSLRGFKVAMNWCAAVIDDSVSERIDESMLAAVD